jgi:hypothetical protein
MTAEAATSVPAVAADVFLIKSLLERLLELILYLPFYLDLISHSGAAKISFLSQRRDNATI